MEIDELMHSFFTEMNNWERFCNQIDRESTFSYEIKSKKQKDEVRKITDKYLTKKERKMGLPEFISYGDEGSYSYNPDEEEIVVIEIIKNNATVTTARKKPIEQQYRYFLKKSKDGWLIDSKKDFLIGKENGKAQYYN